MTECSCNAIPVEGMTRHRPDCALNRRDFGEPDTRPTIDVSAHTVAIGVLCGLMQPCGDGEWELTPKGSAWLAEWTAKKIAEAEA